MLYMVLERFKEGAAPEIYLRFREKGRMMPEGLEYVSSWIDPAKPALTIVRGGPFRFTRNPMYLALCLLQIALGFFLNDWITLLFVVPLALILHYGVILREEKYLTAKFGEPYLQLTRDVRRWF